MLIFKELNEIYKNTKTKIRHCKPPPLASNPQKINLSEVFQMSF